MDEVVCWPAASCTSPSASFSTAGHYNPELGFVSSEDLERWLGSDDDFLEDGGVVCGDEGSRSAGQDDDYSRSRPGKPTAPAAPKTKRRGRKPGPRTNGPVLSHVEAERQRRDKLNRRFCELRAAVPSVSRMDKASLLADAAAYIAELRDRVEHLEAAAAKHATATTTTTTTSAAAAVTCGDMLAGVGDTPTSFGGGGVRESLEVRMVGQDAAALRLTTTAAARHAPAQLMLALRALDLPVQHACVCRVGGVTVQDAVVDVPAAALRSEPSFRAALLHSLQRFMAS